MMWGWGLGGSWMMWLAMGVQVLFWLALLGLIVWAITRLADRPASATHQPGGPSAGPSAMEILRQRYARGEIDAATFDQMRERLEATERATAGPSQ